MNGRPLSALRLTMLFALLVGFLAMHGMSSTTTHASHGSLATLTSPPVHHAGADTEHLAVPRSNHGTFAGDVDMAFPPVASGVEGPETDHVTSGCVVALVGLVWLLAFLARLRNCARPNLGGSLAEPLRVSVVANNLSPPGKLRLHMTLCMLRT